MSVRYLLDTNAASAFVRRRGAVRARAIGVSVSATGISAVTAAELEFGIAKNPSATALVSVVKEFLRYANVLPWSVEIAPHYGTLRAMLEKEGVTIAPLDLMISAHALALDATLISADKALSQVSIVRVEDWSV